MDFSEFIDTLKETNVGLDFFTDFEKIFENVKKIELKLNVLNYLIGKSDIKSAVYDIYNTDPSAFEVLPILIAIRKKREVKVIDDEGNVKRINDYLHQPDMICKFIEETGLIKLFKDEKVKNLIDYVLGIEVGLDTNARKNRSGIYMERFVASIFEKNGIPYEMQYEPPNLNLGDDSKRFDFSVKTSRKTYLIEVNFYNTGGSKLNEVARSYTELGEIINKHSEYEFVWITDGMGWLQSKSKIQEAFNRIKRIYNLTTVKYFLEDIKREL